MEYVLRVDTCPRQANGSLRPRARRHIGASRVDIVATAHAISPILLLLTSSPVSIVVGGGAAFIEARNSTRNPVTIVTGRLDNAVSGQAIVPTEGGCVPGLTLGVGKSCFVSGQSIDT